MSITIRIMSVIALCTLSLASSARTDSISVTELRCEYQREPLAVDAAKPRLTFVMNSAVRADLASKIQILVASSPSKLGMGKGDLWSATLSQDQFPVIYTGATLHSHQACYWKVRAADAKRIWGAWSAPSFWEMGLQEKSDWKAVWINDGKPNSTTDADFYRDDPAPLFRKEFRANKKVVKARLAITGLGYYSASMNGQKIGTNELGPAWSRYSKRVYYSVYDVTPMITRGVNCLGVTLGNGWYNPLPLRMWGNYDLRKEMPVGRPRFISQLEITYADGSHETVVSDLSWKVADGPLSFNSIYLGEVYDARKELLGWNAPGYHDGGWREPAVAAEQIGALQSQSQPPIRVTAEVPAIALTQPEKGQYIFDLGQNFAGGVRLKLRNLPEGTHVKLRFGEILQRNGYLNPYTSAAGQIKGMRKLPDGTQQSVGGAGAPPIAWQKDEYIAAGRPVETWSTSFTFHGYRYVEVEGLLERPDLDTVTGLRMNSDVPSALSITTDNELINKIQKMCNWTFKSNIFSVQSDCPHRERFGYGGDLVATCDTFMMNFDMDRFYAKADADWQDSALPDGMLTDTAPFVGIQYCGLAWAMAHPLLQYRLAQVYGDNRLTADQFETSRKWFDLVIKRNPSLIISEGLSDHETLAPTSTPVLVTPLFYQTALIMSNLAASQSTTGTPSQRETHLAQVTYYQNLAQRISDAFCAKYVDSSTGKVADGTQACQAFALETGILPQSLRTMAFNRLVDVITGPDKLHVSTGIFGTNFVLNALSANGRGDLAAQLVQQNDFPGWGYMLKNGATTLWEHWAGSDGTYSHNHPMFGSVSRWIAQWVGGIEPSLNSVDFHPLCLTEVRNVTCTYHSCRGDIACSTHRDGDTVTIDVHIPVGMGSHIILPPHRGAAQYGSGEIWPGIETTVLDATPDHRIERIRLKSGNFRFTIHS